VAESSEHSIESSCSIKDGEFLGQLSDCQLLSKDNVPWSEFVNLGCAETIDFRVNDNGRLICVIK
jgi:hypothetical protein